MRLFFSLMICLYSFTYLYAQRVEWIKTFGTDDYDMSSSLAMNKFGDFAFTGFSGVDLDTDNGSCFWIVGTDQDGTMLWENYEFRGECIRSWDIQSTIDGGYVVVGGGNDQGRIVRVDGSGNTIWTSTYPDFESNGTEYHAVKELSDGGFILVGRIDVENADAWWVRTDENGMVLWDGTYGGSQWDVLDAVDETLDGGFIAAGFTNSFGSDDMLIIRIDESGNLLWTRTIGSSIRDNANSVRSTAEGNHIIVGNTRQYGDLTDADVWIVMINDFGDTLWTKGYGGSQRDWAISVEPANDFGYIIGANTRSFGNGATDAWLFKIDETGEMIWDITVGESNDDVLGGNDSFGSHSVVQTNEGDLYFIGHTKSYGAAGTDAWLVKVAEAPIASINADSVWIDENRDGYAFGVLDGRGSYSPKGSYTFRWYKESVFLSSDSQITMSLPTGSHNFKLIIGDSGVLEDTTEVQVNVVSQIISTGGPITSAVSSIGDSLFFSSSTDDKIYHFDKDGITKWFLKVGGAIQSTTTVGPNNRIYVGSSDTRLYAFNLDGNFEWDVSMGGVITASPAITPDDILYVGVDNGRLFSINGVDGSINWNFLTGGPVSSSASIGIDGSVYVGSDDGRLYAFNPDGTLKWFFGSDGAIQSSPALDGVGNIYIGSNDGILYAINSIGTELWNYPTRGAIKSSPVIDAVGTIYFGSMDSTVYAVSSSGQLVWSYSAESPVNGTGGLTFNGILYIGTDSGKLLALSSNGELLWYYQTEGAITAPTLITAHNMIYIGSSDGAVYGLVDPNLINLTKNSVYQNLGQWVTFQKNNKRTGYQGDKMVGGGGLPENFELFQNYPNPWPNPTNPLTTIRYTTPIATNVSIVIYNIQGQEIMRWDDINIPAGLYEKTWEGTNKDGKPVTSGIYFYRLRASDFVLTRKMILLK